MEKTSKEHQKLKCLKRIPTVLPITISKIKKQKKLPNHRDIYNENAVERKEPQQYNSKAKGKTECNPSNEFNNTNKMANARPKRKETTTSNQHRQNDNNKSKYDNDQYQQWNIQEMATPMEFSPHVVAKEQKRHQVSHNGEHKCSNGKLQQQNSYEQKLCQRKAKEEQLIYEQTRQQIEKSFYEQIQRRKQNESNKKMEKNPQQISFQELTLNTIEDPLQRNVAKVTDLGSKCVSKNSPLLYSNSKSVSTTKCYTSYTYNSIKEKKHAMDLLISLRKGSKNIEKFLSFSTCIYGTLFVLIYCTILIRTTANAMDTLTSKKLLVENITSKYNTSSMDSSSSIITSTSTSTNAAKSPIISPMISSIYFNSLNLTHRLIRRDAANVPDDDDDSSYHEDEFDEYDALIRNKSAKGKYIGAPCDEMMKCESTLIHVTCDKETLTCGCEKNYPVQLGLIKGCDKPKKLGEQCFYDVTCQYNDENSLCVQVRHNALCQCASGFHSVSYTKPTRRVFCTQDLKELTSDLPTLLGVTTGIAVLAGLICMVLHLFSKTKYPRHRNFGDANIPPPIMYSSDTGIPLIVQSGRPSSRSSLRSSGSIGSYGNRRSSSGGVIGGGSGSGGSKGILVSTSRTGSRRPSLASVHSTSSSVRSYSMMRFEKETQQKEIRQEMKLRLARLQQQQQMSQNRPQIIIGDALTMLSGRSEHGASGSGTAMTAFSRLNIATPSPLTPNSTDELLPAVDELQEYPLKSEMLPITSTKTKTGSTLVAAATLTAVQEIATTSSMALAAAATATRSNNITQNAAENSSTIGGSTDSTGMLHLNKSKEISNTNEPGAYIGPCSSSSEAL